MPWHFSWNIVFRFLTLFVRAKGKGCLKSMNVVECSFVVSKCDKIISCSVVVTHFSSFRLVNKAQMLEIQIINQAVSRRKYQQTFKQIHADVN